MSAYSLRRFLKPVVIALSVFVALAAGLYLAFAERLVRDIYAGKSIGLLNGLITQQAQYPVEHYLLSVHNTFWLQIIGIPLTFLFVVLVYRIMRYFFLRLPSPAVAPAAQEDRTFKFDWLLALAIYSLLTIVYYYPCLSTMNTHLIGFPEDNMSGFWDLWWANDMVLHGDQSLTFTNHVYYPQGTSLYYVAWSFYTLAILFPLRLFLGPVSAYNVIVLHTFPLAGLGAFLLVRYLTRNSWLALLGGFLFAFSPFHFVRAQHHYHINNLQFVPFFVLTYIRAVKERTRQYLLLATVFFMLNALADWNYLFFACYFVVFSYIFLAIRNRRWIMPDLIKRNAVIILLPVLLLAVWLVPMIRIGLTSQEINMPGHRTFVVDLWALYVPNADHWLGLIGPLAKVNALFLGNPWENICYLGVVSIVLVVAAFDRIARSAAPYFIAAVAFTIVAMGAYPHVAGQAIPIHLPDRLLSQLPFFSNLRAPVRFMTYVYLFWSVLIVLALRGLLGWVSSRRYKLLLGILVPTLLFLDYFNVCRDKTEVAAPPCYQAIAADSGDFGILNLPDRYVHSCRYMMYQASHRIPIVNGATTRRVGASLIDSLIMDDLEKQRQQLVGDNVKYIVIHRDLLDLLGLPLGEEYGSHYEKVYDDRRSVVYKVY